MREALIQRMKQISPEEQRYLDGEKQVSKDLYSNGCEGEVDSELLLQEGHLVTARLHSRFIEFPQHRHNYIEIMYVCQGSITHVIDGHEIVLEKGDMIFLNPHVMHGIKRSGMEDIGINFIALPEFFDIPLRMMEEDNVLARFLADTIRKDRGVSDYLLFRLGEVTEVENLIENMAVSMLDNRANEDIMNQYSMGLVFLYLLNHMESLTRESSRSYQDMIVQSILIYIDQNYKTANLTKVAEDLHQSLSVLSKLIKKSTGFTFQELLQRKRFQKAVYFLMETEWSIEQIADAVGYDNHSYFYRQFQKKYGLTPRKYRLEHKNDEKIRI